MMNREQLLRHIEEHYDADAEQPWRKYPLYTVFRHRSNQKWFALVMDIPRCKLGLPGAESIDVLNVKCDPFLIGSLQKDAGFYPAYHMSKTNWITIALDGSVEDDKLLWLLDLSFTATAPKKKTARKPRE